jgi:FdhD protein
MVAARTAGEVVVRHTADGRDEGLDDVIVEAPLEIRLDNRRVTTTMRTPGHDFELAVGFCLAEGLLPDDLPAAVRAHALGAAANAAPSVVSVETGGRAPVPTPRLSTTTSSCGWCGTPGSDDDLLTGFSPRTGQTPIDPAVLVHVPDAVRSHQELFTATGGDHAAAAFTPDGEVVVVREDIGRHNAVDKVVGRLLLDDRLPALEMGLFVSGRTSFEIVQKAWAAGFGCVVAVSAPSSLAVAAARRGGIVLAGFARPGRVHIYAESTGAPA